MSTPEGEIEQFWMDWPEAREQFDGKRVLYTPSNYAMCRVGLLEVRGRPGADEKVAVEIHDDWEGRDPYERVSYRWRLTERDARRLRPCGDESADFQID